MSKVKVLPNGTKIGEWVVLSLGKSKDDNQTHLCRCNCGIEREILTCNLLAGNTKSCRTCHYKLRTLPNFGAAKRRVFRRYIKQAKERNYKFELPFEAFCSLLELECFYCGNPPSQVMGEYPGFVYSGVDRVDNTGDYTYENAIPCCWMCNKMKNKLHGQNFVKQCLKIANKWPIENG